MLARAYLRSGGALALIGSGGVESAETALAKIEAGATLVQVYTGLVYRGPALIGEILDGLAAAVGQNGPLAALVGARARQWAAGDG
jgi:dihydroorotate dehydrogenase